VDHEDLYVAHQSLVERAIASVCRRQHLSPADAEDFAGSVRLFLIQDDYAALRKFEGRSSLSTYLLAVIAHRYQDWRNARWGKWRPSAEARRQGPLSVHLERLILRDGLSFDEAHETLKTTLQITESRQALEERVARLPSRSPRRFVSDNALQEHAAPDPPVDAVLRQQEAADAAREARASLAAAIGALPPQDRLILAMRFESGVSVAQIARLLLEDQKALYRRIDKLLAGLRKSLEQAGLTRAVAAEVLSEGGFTHLSDVSASSGETSLPVRLFERVTTVPSRIGGRRDG
jgi:RNA polymerase sigma factor (sigma-70 family)